MMSIQHRVRHALTASIALIGAVSALALAPTPASAEIGPELVRFGEHGSGAGQLDVINGQGGIATDPDTGHVFVTEPGGIDIAGEPFGNNRISEFTAWGEFVKAWGWGVRDGGAELQTCTEETDCQEGLPGDGAGQMSSLTSIAVDPGGNVFVFESGGDSQRIQKFSPAGELLLMIGGEVNKTTGADICTKADLEGGDVCNGGTPGTGPGEFSREEGGFSRQDVIDIGPDGLLYVADQSRIQSFNLNGGFEGELPFSTIHASNPLFPEAPKFPPGPVGNLAIDPLSKDFLLAFVSIDSLCCGESSAWRVSQSGTVLNPAPLASSFPSATERVNVDALASDPAGNAYLAVDPMNLAAGSGRSKEPRVWQLDPGGSRIGECCLVQEPNDSRNPRFVALATNTVTPAGDTDLYVLRNTDNGGLPTETFIEVHGPAPDKWPPPLVPPEVNAQYASSVGAESAVLKAEINPEFWEDTSYRLEYGAAPCSGGGCQALPERQLGAGIVKRDITTDGIVLSGLEPGTTYHYRFSAESSGGGPVFGPDASFTTFPIPKQASSQCPNQAFKTGPSASLADCRAYEMVSPVDKDGADLSTFIQIGGFLARLDQGAASGEKLTYSASTSFGEEAQGGPYSSQYLSTRGADGWQTQHISPSQESGSVYGGAGIGLDSPFKAFSNDLSSGWFVHGSDPPLAPGGLEGFGNLYRRDNLAASYEAQTTVEPPAVEPLNFFPKLLGFSADGSRTFFRALGQLTANASPNTNIEQVYEAHEGQLHLISARPNGKPATVSSGVGAPQGSGAEGRVSNVESAVSEDGRLVYWTEEGGANKLYLRIEGAETVAVSGTKPATFWRASTDGERMLYAEGGTLRRFEQSTRESSTLVPGGVLGVLGASEDLSRIYFASTEMLDGGATAGEPNLYLHEDGGKPRFVATLASNEGAGFAEGGGAIPPVALNPVYHFARVTSDGSVAIFMSRAALTDKDNLDRESGKPAAEVFRYDADADELTCLSCLPTGARPQAVDLKIPVTQASNYLYAAKIPGSEFQFHAPRALSEDGERVFFDSLNRLTLADTNGRQDVYQWEAEGKGECVGSSAPGYDPASSGCVSLISDGRGSTKAEFIDASSDGEDVFFFTGTSLLPQDLGQIDIYDARVGGGFPQPPAPAAECEGEACQSPVSPPPEPSYASQGYQGPGNPKPIAKKAKKAKKKSKKAAKKKVKSKKAKKAKRQKARAKGGRR